MIPVLNIINATTHKLNMLSTLQGQFIPDETIMTFANLAQIKLILKKVGLNNNYTLGLDSFAKRYQDLKNLIVNYETLVASPVNDKFNSFKSDTTALSSKFLLHIDSYVLATKDSCKDRVLNVYKICQHTDLPIQLNSPHSTPSFKYQETIGTISGNYLYTYSDLDNSYTITQLYISYLRYPREIDVAGYIHMDGTASVNSDCELESYLENELVDLIVEELAMNTGNKELASYQLQKNKENE